MMFWIMYGAGCLVCMGIAINHGSEPEDDWWSYLLWPLWLVIAAVWFTAQGVRGLIRMLRDPS